MYPVWSCMLCKRLLQHGKQPRRLWLCRENMFLICSHNSHIHHSHPSLATCISNIAQNSRCMLCNTIYFSRRLFHDQRERLPTLVVHQFCHCDGIKKDLQKNLSVCPQTLRNIRSSPCSGFPVFALACFCAENLFCKTKKKWNHGPRKRWNKNPPTKKIIHGAKAAKRGKSNKNECATCVSLCDGLLRTVSGHGPKQF